MKDKTASVFVAIVGRPNVGKSSLLNRLVGEKAAIVTPKPQTTRTRITGILTKGPVQYVFIDTPGIHTPRTRLGGRMAKTVTESAQEGDVVLMLFEPEGTLRPAEEEMLGALKGSVAYAFINKADTVQKGRVLAERKAEIEGLSVFRQVLVGSAQTGEGCDELLAVLAAHALPGPHFFPDDAYTDQPEKQLAAEIVREKLLLYLQEEIPHGTAVEVERFHEREKPAGSAKGKPGQVPAAPTAVIDMDIVIYCEKKSHKGMIIGKGGQMLKKVAGEARLELEDILGAKVNLQCWVKVREGWRNNDAMLGRMGFK
ncbi:GTPase Era [Ruminococcaceae bacterium OttesenSCG-928-O06]|nr:GTPase Era [Ruminococcaceae bacterium OttesenSCG-928-O06]